jgi:membrane protein DedA with SNARE-associated domain
MNRLWAVPTALLGFYSAHEVAGLFLFLLVEELAAPLFFPGEALIIAAGARPERSVVGALEVILVAATAAVLGSSLLYAAVRRGGRPLLARYGRFLHLDDGRVATLEAWFRRHGALAILVGRLAPGLRTPTSTMAGLFGVPFPTFLPATTVAAVIWAGLYYALGLFLGQQWDVIVTAISAMPLVAAGVLVSLITLAALVQILARRRRHLARPR